MYASNGQPTLAWLCFLLEGLDPALYWWSLAFGTSNKLLATGPSSWTAALFVLSESTWSYRYPSLAQSVFPMVWSSSFGSSSEWQDRHRTITFPSQVVPLLLILALISFCWKTFCTKIGLEVVQLWGAYWWSFLNFPLLWIWTRIGTGAKFWLWISTHWAARERLWGRSCFGPRQWCRCWSVGRSPRLREASGLGSKTVEISFN